MRFFCMPADFKKQTIDEYARLNEMYKEKKSRISETYGNITVENRMESGRVVTQLPRVDLLDLREYIEYSSRKGIDFNYTINAPYLHNREFTREGVEGIKGFLRSLYESKVRSLTIALPSLIELVKAAQYDFKIRASTLCQITNANKARFYKKIGVERIVPDESINRDFEKLKQIRRVFGENVEIIVNPICLKDCIYRMFHYSQIGGDSREDSNDVSINYYEHRCVLQRYGDIANLLKISWVRPEDIKYYTAVGIKYFKLQGRHLVLKGDPVRTVKAYLDEDFDGDLMDIINMFHSINHFKILLDNKKLEGYIRPFIEKEGFCRRDCEICGYCENFARKIIDYPKAAQVIKLANAFYSDYDKYKQMIETVEPQPLTNVNADNIEADFAV